MLLASAAHPSPTASDDTLEAFDGTPSWGTDTPRICAAEGLTALALEPRWATKAVLAAILRLSRDPAPSVRLAVARHINAQAVTAPDLAWTIVDERAAKDPSAAVLTSLLRPLARLANLDEDRGLKIVRRIIARERRRTTRREDLIMDAYELLGFFAAWRNAPQAHAALAQLTKEPVSHADILVRVVGELRDATFHGPAEASDANAASYASIRRRALDVDRAALGPAVAEVARLHSEHARSQRPGRLATSSASRPLRG